MGRGEFTVKFAYRELRPIEEQQVGWPWRMIWRTKIPYKVYYFTWLLAKEEVLTHVNLNKRKHNLCSRCYLCKEQVETVNHLFLHCKWTDQLWQMFIHKRKIKWTKPGRITEVLKCWNIDGNAGKEEERCRILPALRLGNGTGCTGTGPVPSDLFRFVPIRLPTRRNGTS